MSIDENGLVLRFVHDSWQPLCHSDNFTLIEANKVCHSVGLARAVEVSSLNISLQQYYNANCSSGQKVICETFDCKLESYGAKAVTPQEINSLMNINSQFGSCKGQIISPLWLLSTYSCLR